MLGHQCSISKAELATYMQGLTQHLVAFRCRLLIQVMNKTLLGPQDHSLIWLSRCIGQALKLHTKDTKALCLFPEQACCHNFKNHGII